MLYELLYTKKNDIKMRSHHIIISERSPRLSGIATITITIFSNFLVHDFQQRSLELKKYSRTDRPQNPNSFLKSTYGTLRKMNVLKNKSYTRQWEYGLLSSLHCVKLMLWSVSVSGTSSISEWRNRNVWLCGLNTDIKQQFLLCIWIRLHGVNNTLSNNVLLWCNTTIRLCNSYTFQCN